MLKPYEADATKVYDRTVNLIDSDLNSVHGYIYMNKSTTNGKK